MDPMILAVVFLGSNLWGMYGRVPFININPTNTFLERFVGSFQLTSVIFGLQEIHPLAFLGTTLDPPSPNTDDSSPLPPKLDVVRTVGQYVEGATARFATPGHRTVNVTETSLQPIWEDPMGSQRYDEQDWVFFFVGVVVIMFMSILFVWNSERRPPYEEEDRPIIVQSSSENQPDQLSQGVVVDKVLFERLIETLSDEFQKRPAAQGQGNEDAASNVVSILDLLKVKIPAGAGNDKEPRMYRAILRLSERITKVEKGFDLMFPAAGVAGANGLVNDSGASSQTPSQPGFAQYRKVLDKSMNEIDEGMKNYTKLAGEVSALKDSVVTQESFNDHIQGVRNEMAKLQEALAPSTKIDEWEQLSDTEKATARHYTDDRVKKTNSAWQARCTYLEGELRRLGVHLKEIEQTHGLKLEQFDPAVSDTVSSLQEDVENIKKRQDGMGKVAGGKVKKLEQATQKLDLESKRLSHVLESQPPDLEPLTILGRQFATDDPYRQALVKKLTSVVKWIHHIGETLNGYGARLTHLGEQIEFLRINNVWLEAQNQKLWATLKTVAPEHVHNVEGRGEKDNSEAHQSGPHDGAENAAGVESQAAAHQKEEDSKAPDTPRPPKPNVPAGPGNEDKATAAANHFSTERVNLYDADTDQDSNEDAVSEASRPSAADDLTSQSSSTGPASSAGGDELAGADTPLTFEMEGMEGPASDEISAAWEREIDEHFRTEAKIDHPKMESEGAPSAPETDHPTLTPESNQSKGKGETEKPGEGQTHAQGPANGQALTRSEEPKKREQTDPDPVRNDGPVKPEGVKPNREAGEAGEAGPASVSQPPIAAPGTSTGSGKPAKQEAEAGKSQDQNQAGTATPGKLKLPPNLPTADVSFDFKVYGDPTAKKAGPSYPPAGTKTDYQPSTPKKQRHPKGAQGKGKEPARRPIDQPPPLQESARTEKQQKLESWSKFSKETRSKEIEENKKIREEALTEPGPKSAPWEENVTWKQSKGSPVDTNTEPGSNGRRTSAPPGIQEFVGTAKGGSGGDLPQQSQSPQQPPAAGSAGSSAQSPEPSNRGSRGSGSGGQGGRGRAQTVIRKGAQ